MVIQLARALGFEVDHVYDDDRSTWSTAILGVPVAGPIDSANGSVSAVMAIGDNRHRSQLVQRLNCRWQTMIHPTAFVDGTASIGVGSVVLPNAVVHTAARIGEHSIVNTASIVEHDCRVESFVHLAPACKLAGSVIIESGALVGMNAAVRQGVRVGGWATVGMCSAVLNDVEAHTTVMGIPAKRSKAAKTLNTPGNKQP